MILGIRPQPSCHICGEHISRNGEAGAVNSPQNVDYKQTQKHNKFIIIWHGECFQLSRLKKT